MIFCIPGLVQTIPGFSSKGGLSIVTVHCPNCNHFVVRHRRESHSLGEETFHYFACTMDNCPCIVFVDSVLAKRLGLGGKKWVPRKTIARKCLICGKRIRVKLFKGGQYFPHHYFGKPRFPIEGTGKYVKTGTAAFFGKKHDVVKWTGKSKMVEYWECEKCDASGKGEN